MTDSLPIIKVPDADDIFVDYIHAAFQGLISEVLTGSEATPISYVGKGRYWTLLGRYIYYSRLRPTLENGIR